MCQSRDGVIPIPSPRRKLKTTGNYRTIPKLFDKGGRLAADTEDNRTAIIKHLANRPSLSRNRRFISGSESINANRNPRVTLPQCVDLARRP